MGLHTLKPLFHPTSIAVIGASRQPHRAGYLLMRNLLDAGFKGRLLPISRHDSQVLDIPAYADVEQLPLSPDLAVICINGNGVCEVLNALAAKGCYAAIVIAAERSAAQAAAIYALAKQLNIRLLGMSSLGIILPHQQINASLAHCHALPGNIAFISQSAAVCTTVLDWANSKQIGFSAFISIGSGEDISFATLLDQLARDAKTQSILLYLDSVQDARPFLSAARAIALHKPVLVIKSGRSAQGAQAAELHSKGQFGHDSVYDAAIKRAGMLRVKDLHELFAAVETLAYGNHLQGERLAIMSNGGGLGIMAVDHLMAKGGRLAQFDAALFKQLNGCLPAHWSRNNPIDMIGDADPTRYAQTLTHLMDSEQIDAILILHAPSALCDSDLCAQAVIDVINAHPRRRRVNIVTNWSGESAATSARGRFNQANIPTFRTPNGAISAFMHLVQHRRNKKLLLETPAALSETMCGDSVSAHRFISAQLDAHPHGRTLSTYQAQPILATYQLQSIPTEIVSNEQQALHKGALLGYPLAVKIDSPDIEYKSQVHGVMLNIDTPASLSSALRALKQRVTDHSPSARLNGFTLQKMVASGIGLSLRVMIKQDPTFGPIIGVSQESDARDLHSTLDNAVVALPPLNMALARYLMIEGINSKKIKIKRAAQEFSMDAVCLMLVRVSQMLLDNPEVTELDINPLLVVGEQVSILDSHLQLAKAGQRGQLAISPYRKQLEENAVLKDGQSVLLRPIIAEDEVRHQAFDAALSEEDRYKRYFSPRAKISHEEMAFLTQIDYAREMAFIALASAQDGTLETLAVVRASVDPDNIDAEFAMVVRSDKQGVGLGELLLSKLVRYQREQGTRYLSGITMLSNRGMANLAKKLGFEIERDIAEGVISMRLSLSP